MIPFTKLQGIGNDYIYINAIEHPIKDPASLSISMSDRHFGIGADGIILILASDKNDFKMRMFNADGSESEMCGNGIRCFAKYVYDNALTRKKEISIETGAGIKYLTLFMENDKVAKVRVDMGEPQLERNLIPMQGALGRVLEEPIQLKDGTILHITAVSMGNPHSVIFVDDAKNFPVHVYGPEIENSPLFPRRTNVEFVTVVNRREVIQRTWERGSGETLACGTGASAVCTAGFITGKTDRSITSHLPGGDLELELDEKTGHIFMTGPAVKVFSGEWEDVLD
jgi:diaminopimelate epimerase